MYREDGVSRINAALPSARSPPWHYGRACGVPRDAAWYAPRYPARSRVPYRAAPPNRGWLYIAGDTRTTALTLELPPDVFTRLRTEAERVGKPRSAVVQEWVAERLPAAPPAGDRARARRAARRRAVNRGPRGPELRRRAETAQVTLEEVSADLERAGGRPLSEIILEQRGPKG